MHKSIQLGGCLAVLCLTALCVCAAEQRDAYGGWTGLQGKNTGYFHTEQIDGAWWFVTPAGNVFFSKGVNNINYQGDTSRAFGYSPYGRLTAQKYGSAREWAEATAERLQGWGFNTVGAWSTAIMTERQMPYTPVLNLAASSGANWLRGEVADVFSPQFQSAVQRQAERLCSPKAHDPYLLGYFTDNELRWGADWRSKKTLFDDFLALPAARPGKQVIVRLLRARYPTLDAFNQACGTAVKDWDEVGGLTALTLADDARKALDGAFLHEYARAYFKTCRDAIKAADPNHMVLGCRFAGYAPDPVVEAMGDFVDVVSFNNYGAMPPAGQLQKLHQITGKPVALTEFSFKAMDSGLPNTKGAGRPLATQQERADHFDQYVTALAQTPFMVGFQWFEYEDEPAQGRFDGENSNYGLVNIKDEPWQVLVERMTRVNSGLDQVHSRAGK
jgi:Beta-galactosidase